MREIKFRAWDKKRGGFHFGCSNICLTLGGRLMWQFGFNSPDLLDKEEAEDYELMQYTGLLDKNGVEIYEGDIVQWWNKVSDPVIVEATNGGWNPFIDECTTDHSYHYEVIGNIYEGASK